jgi:hypothetical protein
MNHLKLVRPVTRATRSIPGVSFLIHSAQIAFELASDALQRPADISPARPVGASPRQPADVAPALLVDTSTGRPVDASPAAPKRNTKLKGDIAELRVAAALTQAGYAVSKPLGENQRYDLIADDGKRLSAFK